MKKPVYLGKNWETVIDNVVNYGYNRVIVPHS